MAKQCIAIPPKGINQWMDIHMDKTPDEMALILREGDTLTEFARLTMSDASDRRIVITLLDEERAEIQTEDGAAPQVAKKFDKRAGRPVNWDIEDERDKDNELTGRELFCCWLPNGNEVRIPVADKPGPLTPRSAPQEIRGQDVMLFTLALGIATGQHSLLTGPTGIGKTTVYRWLAHRLNYNFVMQSVTRGTQDRHMVGEYAPAGPGDFRWTYGPVAKAAMHSRTHPTMLVFDEINRIGNVQEFARIYPLLDDTRMIELSEKRAEDAALEEIIEAGDLFIGATSNPVDDEGADYIGVRELDPAFLRRLPLQPRLSYPPVEDEARALTERVDSLDRDIAMRMLDAANRIRNSTEVRFPVSFTHLETWARTMPYFGYAEAAELSVIQHAPMLHREEIRDMLRLQSTKF